MNRLKPYTPDDVERIALQLVEVYQVTTFAQRKSGRTWYHRANEAVSKLALDTSLDRELIAHCIAALSPLKRWEQNLSMARVMIHRFTTGQTFSNPGTFHRTALTAWACLEGDLITSPRSPKTKAFALAILGDTEAVVVDSHMMDLCGHHKPWLSLRQYDALATAITMAGLLCGESPRDMQAILWVHKRDGENADDTPF